jgi:hypothetical protein
MIDSDYYVGTEFSLSGLGEGIHLIRWGSQDNLGINETGNAQQFVLDVMAPETELEIQGPHFQESQEEDLFVNRYTTFTFLSQDNQSGISYYWYMIDDDFFLGSSFKLTGYTDGQYTIQWGAVDKLSHNETGNEMTIYVDNKPPIIMDGIGSPNVPFEDYTLINSSTFIFLNSIDEDVGGSAIYYSVDGGSIFQEYESPLTLSYKTRQIVYWAVDALGNSANESIINILVDNTDSDLDGIDDITDNDDDGDGLLDSEEDKNGNGVVDSGETNPKNPDTDFDGVPDEEDPYPLDKSRWGQKEESMNIVGFILFIVVGVLITLLFLFMIMRKPRELSQEVKFEPHDKEEVDFEPHGEEEMEIKSHAEEEVEFESHEEEFEFEPHNEEEVEFKEPDEPYEEEIEFESNHNEELDFEPYEEDEAEFELEEDEDVEFDVDEEKELEFEEE